MKYQPYHLLHLTRDLEVQKNSVGGRVSRFHAISVVEVAGLAVSALSVEPAVVAAVATVVVTTSQIVVAVVGLPTSGEDSGVRDWVLKGYRGSERDEGKHRCQARASGCHLVVLVTIDRTCLVGPTFPSDLSVR